MNRVEPCGTRCFRNPECDGGPFCGCACHDGGSRPFDPWTDEPAVLPRPETVW